MQQELKSERTKEIILDQAFKLFYENGFKSTSIDKVMKATTLTKGAFYHHYGSKMELGLAVIGSRVRKRVYDSMIVPLYETGAPLMILETTFLQRLKSFPFYEMQHGCPMNNLINEIGGYESVYQETLKAIVEEWRLALVFLLERGKREREVREDISSEAVAIYLISGFEGIRGIRKLYGDDVILEDYLLGLSAFLNQLRA